MNFSIHFHAINAKDFCAHIEANEATGGSGPYYTLRISSELAAFLSDDQCRQLLEVLASRPPLPTISEMSGLLDSSAEIFAPECPDSPDGKHHEAPIGIEEQYIPRHAVMCHYCGEKATPLPNRRDNSEFRDALGEALRSDDAPF